eukprot:GHVT01080496.1.p2 GENE.GHVT01080496.1~~GHVT01080496.1.p2  ORF type:complete len:108 (+),score=5.57 GHVT01080496.1:325-648(+)
MENRSVYKLEFLTKLPFFSVTGSCCGMTLGFMGLAGKRNAFQHKPNCSKATRGQISPAPLSTVMVVGVFPQDANAGLQLVEQELPVTIQAVPTKRSAWPTEQTGKKP